MRGDRERADDQVDAGRFLDRNEFDADSQIRDLGLLVDDIGVVKDVIRGLEIAYWEWVGAADLRMCVSMHGAAVSKEKKRRGMRKKRGA